MDPKATLAYQDKVPSTYHYDYVICGMNSHRQPESPSSASHQPRSAFRLRNAFFTEDFRNRVTILGLQDEQDNYGNYGEFVTHRSQRVRYTPRRRCNGSPARAELCVVAEGADDGAPSGDSPRVFEYASDALLASSSFVGRRARLGGHSLSLQLPLSGVSSSLTFSPPNAEHPQ